MVKKHMAWLSWPPTGDEEQAGHVMWYSSAGLKPVHVSSLKIKRNKGIWWMPWHQKAMKDVALCEKFRGIESEC